MAFWNYTSTFQLEAVGPEISERYIANFSADMSIGQQQVNATGSITAVRTMMVVQDQRSKKPICGSAFPSSISPPSWATSKRHVTPSVKPARIPTSSDPFNTGQVSHSVNLKPTLKLGLGCARAF